MWALNVVARDDAALVETAIDAGHELQAAMGGGDRADRAAAQQAERQATEALVEAAGARIEAQDHQATDAFRQRIQTTIRAAQLDEDVAGRLRAGRLEVDEEVSIFGGGPFTATPGSTRKPRSTPTPKPAKARTTTETPATAKVDGEPVADPEPAGPTAEERAAERAAEEARRAAVARFRTLGKEADRLERHAERLERDADELRQRADDATAAATEARDEADAARDEARAADPDA